MKSSRRALSVLPLLSLALLAAPACRADNIFDDGWTPPKRPAEPSAPSVGKPVEPTPPAVAPVAPVTPKPPAPDAPTPAAPGRRPVPPEAELGRSRTLLRQVFAADLADRSPAARRALSAKLAAEASREASNPSDQFVLLAGAFDAAREGNDLRAALGVVDALERAFAVTALDWQASAGIAFKYQADPARLAANVAAALPIADALCDADDVPSATRLLAAVQQGAGNAPPTLLRQVQRRAQTARALAALRDRAARDRARLASAPDDPAANGSLGAYLCFGLRRWDEGLPMLAKAADEKLRAAATADRAAATAPDALADAADAWWDLADAQPDTYRPAVLDRAADAYRRALPALTGLRRAQVEKRLATAATPTAGAADDAGPAVAKPAVAAAGPAATVAAIQAEVERTIGAEVENKAADSFITNGKRREDFTAAERAANKTYVFKPDHAAYVDRLGEIRQLARGLSAVPPARLGPALDALGAKFDEAERLLSGIGSKPAHRHAEALRATRKSVADLAARARTP